MEVRRASRAAGTSRSWRPSPSGTASCGTAGARGSAAASSGSTRRGSRSNIPCWRREWDSLLSLSLSLVSAYWYRDCDLVIANSWNRTDCAPEGVPGCTDSTWNGAGRLWKRVIDLASRPAIHELVKEDDQNLSQFVRDQLEVLYGEQSTVESLNQRVRLIDACPRQPRSAAGDRRRSNGEPGAPAGRPSVRQIREERTAEQRAAQRADARPRRAPRGRPASGTRSTRSSATGSLDRYRRMLPENDPSRRPDRRLGRPGRPGLAPLRDGRRPGRGRGRAPAHVAASWRARHEADAGGGSRDLPPLPSRLHPWSCIAPQHEVMIRTSLAGVASGFFRRPPRGRSA